MVTARRCVVLALVLVVVLSACSACFADAAEDYARGLGLQIETKYREAIAEFAKVPADSELAPKACCEMAKCYRELMNLDDAAQACRKGLGLAAASEDRTALEALLKELRFAPVGSLRKQEKWKQAIEWLQTLTQDYPEDAQWLIARCYYSMGEYQNALDALTALVRDYPTSAIAVLQDAYRARCMFLLGREGEASSHLVALIGRSGYADPYIVETADAIAEVCRAKGHPEQAAAFYSNLAAATPGHAIVAWWRIRLADVQYDQRAWAAARDAYDAICRQYTDGNCHIVAEYRAADCCEKMGEYTGAVTRFEALGLAHSGINVARDVPFRLGRLRERNGG